MSKETTKLKLKNKMIAVIREPNFQLAKKICETLVENGIECLEITFSIPNAEELIADLSKTLPLAFIGAGTVLNKEQAKKAIDAGANFIMSPCIVEEVGSYCKEKDILCSMGAMTPSEAYQSYLLGSDIVKLFPGEMLAPRMIKAIHAPMPFIDIMPTGGVDHKNVKEWLDLGAYACGFGGYFSKDINFENLDLLKIRIKQLLEAVGENK
jgi:Entner-Doudoroff aldolase